LVESYEEIPIGTARLIKFEDFIKKEEYIDKLTPEEKQKERRQYRQIAAKNEITFKITRKHYNKKPEYPLIKNPKIL